jgi:hypothetical protein
MARELFIPWKPHAATLTVVEQANIIIDEYFGLGFNLTLRQLFYQFVARAALENIFREYKRLGTIVRNARDAGLIDWDAIEDRTREVRTHSFWTNPAGIISSAAESYREDLWAGQKYRPEVWIEKDALIGVAEGVCTELRVPYFAHRGNNSQTLQYQAGKRFARYLDLGLIPLILHLADHDPNGIDMTRDNEQRLKLYTRAEIEIRRIALNLDQVRLIQPATKLRQRERHPHQRLSRPLRHRRVLGVGRALAHGHHRPDPHRAPRIDRPPPLAACNRWRGARPQAHRQRG